MQVIDNNITITNSGSQNWSFRLTAATQDTLEINNIITEDYLIESLDIATYILKVIDDYNLTDTLIFSINFDDDTIVNEPEASIFEIEIIENNLTITNLGIDNWSFNLIGNAQYVIEVNNIVTEDYLVESLPTGNYILTVTNNYNSTDSILFSIDYEEQADLTNTVDDNLLSSCNLSRYENGYKLDLSQVSLTDNLFIQIISLNGQIINHVVVNSNQDVYINIPDSKTYYLLVVKYKGDLITHKVSALQ